MRFHIDNDITGGRSTSSKARAQTVRHSDFAKVRAAS
jgi:hypothetical protein